jgi:hypothetical protein
MSKNGKQKKDDTLTETDKTDKKEDKATEKEDKKPVEAKEAKTADVAKKEKNDVLGEEEVDENDLVMEDQRESIPLTPENARFYKSQGGLISLDLINAKGEKETFERIVILRAFPITNPEEFLSVREPDSKKMGRGKEIGMIRYMNLFDEATSKLFLEELDRRYFTPKLTKILSIKDKFGYLYWDADTSAGHVTFVLTNPFSNLRVLEDKRIIINDIDGNVFEIPDPKKLDTASYRKIEMYL